jgi:ubiquitin-conjugating enzyme E2 O
MPAFDVYDAVVLKSDPTLVGTVERTNFSDGEQSSLEDLLIVNYTDTPEHVLIAFVNSGLPPPGYILVVCADDERGAFLAHENDLKLHSRSFDLGDVVKQVGQLSSMVGTVIKCDYKYDLESVFLTTRDGTLTSTLVRNETSQTSLCRSDCPVDEGQHNIIKNVPAEEITDVDNVFEGDLAILDDWVGAIEESDFDIALAIGNSVVVLRAPEDLYVPIRDPEKPIVSLPEFDNLARPAVLSAFQGWSTIPAPKTPRLGAFVTTSRDTLRSGRWLKGEYNSSRLRSVTGVAPTPHEGVVIAAIPRTISIRWLAPNPFTRKATDDIKLPSHRHAIYRNISTFRNPSELRARENLKILDGDPHPSLRLGDQVRFRDPTAAAVKYAGVQGTLHGAFRRLDLPEQLDGWDLNVLKVMTKYQTVAVQWQDGTVTDHSANDLQRFAAFESALTPGQVVLHRLGLKQYPLQDGPLPHRTEIPNFNEMAFFERPHVLFPANVGVVQAVDHQERIVTVRWFEKPEIILADAGESLDGSSWFGPISENVEALSLYEVMTFPALDRRIRDIVLLPPHNTFERLQRNLRNKPLNEETMMLSVDVDVDWDLMLHRAWTCLRHPDVTKQNVCAEEGGDGAWVGELVKLNLDGTLTVSLMSSKTRREIRIPLDMVLACLNMDEFGAMDYGEPDDLEEWWEDYVDGHEDISRSPSPISEHIEYEGGQRLDQDEDDDNWISAEEDLDDLDDSKRDQLDNEGDVVMGDQQDAGTQTAPALPIGSSASVNGDGGSNVKTSLHLAVEAPPAFEVLEISPPPDQFSGDLSPNTPSSFLKRLQKEHKTLGSSLPDGQIYVRTYESRLDLLRCLIIGPPDTPYEDAPFLVDLYLGPKFPDEPPVAHFHSWTSGLGRINPNLYEEGKICLSLLGTWPGKEKGEGWSPDATILQLLVSLQGLVMVRNPFFNEAGFENEEASGGYKLEAAQYAEKAFLMARRFVKHALEQPPVGLESALAWLYLPRDGVRSSGLITRILQRGAGLLKHNQALRAVAAAGGGSTADQDVQLTDAAGSTGDPTTAFLRPLSMGAMAMLERTLREISEIDDRLREDFGERLKDPVS